jgi:hypothetical protein
VSASQRRKGRQGENELVAILGGDARRISVSGLPGPDVLWRRRYVEVKRLQDGFKLDYRWLRDAQIVAKRADRKDWLVTMRLDTLLDMLEEAEDA